jgi:hypothetical protein
MEQTRRASSEQCPRINTEELNETTKNLSQVSRFAAEIRTGEISEKESKDLPLEPTLSVFISRVVANELILQNVLYLVLRPECRASFVLYSENGNLMA